MSSKCVIHVGLHKTASTFLQDVVFPSLNKRVLLTRPFTQHNHAFNRLQYADDSLYNSADVMAEIDRFAGKNLLLSDEAFSGRALGFAAINRAMIARRLCDLFPDSTLVVFIRDQKDIIQSHYSSYLRQRSGTKLLEDFLWRPSRNMTYEEYASDRATYPIDTLYYNTNESFIHLDCFLYAPLVSLYRELFPRVEILLYEDLVAEPERVFGQLADVLGEEICIDGERRSVRVNPALSPREMARLRSRNRWNRMFHGKVARRLAQTADSLRSHDKDMRDLAERVAATVGEYYAADNRNLRKLCPQLGWERYPSKYG